MKGVNMKKKIIFLCTLLASSLVSNLALSGNKFSVNENYLNELDNGGSFTSFKKGQMNKFIGDFYLFDENIACPWCGRINRTRSGENRKNCEYCGKNLYATFYTKVCPRCEFPNSVETGKTIDTCVYCHCGFEPTTTVSFEACYECGGAQSPLIGNKCMLMTDDWNILYTTKTDIFGQGSFVIDENFEGSSLKLNILISAGNDDVILETDYEPFAGRGLVSGRNKWSRLITKDYSVYNEHETYKNPYIYKSIEIIKGKNNVVDKAVVLIEDQTTYSYRNFTDDSFGMLFYIGQMIMRASEFSKKCNAYSNKGSIDEVYVLYTGHEDESSSSNTNYCHWGQNIRVYKYGSLTPDVFMHEYGHHVQHQLGVNKSPAKPHTLTENHYRLGEKDGAYEAWVESWASVFSLVAQNTSKNLFYNDPNPEILRKLGFTGTYGDSIYNSKDFELNDSTRGYYIDHSVKGVAEYEEKDINNRPILCNAPAD